MDGILPMEPFITSTLQRPPAPGYGAEPLISPSASTGLQPDGNGGKIMTVSIKAKWVLPVILAVVLIVTGAWGFSQYRINQQYRIHMENIYQKSFYELVGNVGSVESSLAKLMVSGDENQ
ncbi:MAG TPA: hypothetical protein DDW86_05940, partial [Clostridiales bacterium]|nr:hypothetical protein [Clostridiales bacterium]